MLPLTLLVILGLAGLRGAMTRPRWNGPLRHDGLVIGLALEVILGVLLLLTYRRRARAMRGGVPVNDVAAKLRGFLVLVLGAGMIAVAVAIFLSLHLHLGGGVQPAPTFSVRPLPKRTPRPQGAQPGGSLHVPVTVILYVLLVVLLVAAVLLSIWWSRRFGPSFGGRTSGFLAEDPEDLREAVESAGRRCVPSTTRGRPSSPATWRWRPAWPSGARPGPSPTPPTACWPGRRRAAWCAGPLSEHEAQGLPGVAPARFVGSGRALDLPGTKGALGLIRRSDLASCIRPQNRF